tara:strand:- start:860 stop:1198 length:339 start_codon:yes stop_codon:yes gene_type:complete
VYWLEFLKPYHKLANKEIEALGLMLYYRHELSKEVSNEDLVDKLLFSSDIRQKIKTDLGGMKNGVFNNLLSTLRRKKVLSTKNKITSSLIPNKDPMSKEFSLVFNFQINEDK